MSNYIIDYLTGNTGFGMEKEAGIFDALAKKITSLVGKGSKKPVSFTRHNIIGTAREADADAIKELMREVSRDNSYLRMYENVPGIANGTSMNRFMFKLREEAPRRQAELIRRISDKYNKVKDFSSPAYASDMLYQGGRKGLLANFSKAPNTASMSDELASAIAKDENFAKSLLSGSAPSMFSVSGNSTAKVLSKLGLL